MPTSSPKVFHSRPPSTFLSPFRRLPPPPLSAACLLVAFVTLLFLVNLISKVLIVARSCSSFEPLSVSVAWEQSDEVRGGNRTPDSVRLKLRHKVMGFVGVQTGFGSMGRRRSLRKTWFPSDRQGLLSLEKTTGLVFRFVIGKTTDQRKVAALRREVEQYDDFILLDIVEEYSNLPYKTLAFFKAAYALFDAEFYVKADDDIYLRPDRLSSLLAKERFHPQTYIGCMKKGPVFTDPKLKWYEPLSHLLGSEYFLHAYGPIYALSADVVSSLVALKNSSFRMFSNEDVTIGAWMLAMNVNHENNHALCEPDCTPSSIAVWDIPKCSGLCNPESKLLLLHQKESCSGSATAAATTSVDRYL